MWVSLPCLKGSMLGDMWSHPKVKHSNWLVSTMVCHSDWEGAGHVGGKKSELLLSFPAAALPASDGC